MAKYRKKPVVVSAEIFKLGMEDGYMNFHESLGENVKGIRLVKKPYIKTLEGEHPVETGKHYIVTGVRGDRYPVEKEIFEETYDLVDEVYEEMLQNTSQDSSIFGTEQLEYLLKCLEYKTKNNRYFIRR